VVQGRPRVVHAPEHGHGQQDEREQHLNLLRVDERAQHQPARRGQQRARDHDEDEHRPVADVDARRLALGVDEQHRREDDQPADEPLETRRHDLLDRQQRDGQRRQRAVGDRALPGQLHHQREDDGQIFRP
jgi:hypothetical protein